MAINEDDLDLDTEKAEEGEGKSSSGMKKIILLVVIAIAVIAVTVGATLYFTGVIGGGDEPTNVATEAGEAGADGEKKEEQQAAAKEKDLSDEAIYHLFEPPFTVNFNDNGKIRFLQVGLSVSTRDKNAIETMLQHEPVIRNNLVLLFSSQKSEELYTREGKNKLRDDVLAEIQNIMQANTGDKAIDNIYFTGFVIQ